MRPSEKLKKLVDYAKVPGTEYYAGDIAVYLLVLSKKVSKIENILKKLSESKPEDTKPIIQEAKNLLKEW